jgi:hypothetical protein
MFCGEGMEIPSMRKLKFRLSTIPPFAGALASYRVPHERATGRKDIHPMRLIGNFHAGKPGANLRAVQFLELLFG